METPLGIFFFFNLSQWNWAECCQFCFSQHSNFQEINYGLIIKKEKKNNNVHNLFALTVTSLLWRHEVSNLSGGFEGDLPCWRCVCLWRLVWLLSMPHLQTFAHTQTHTHILWSFPMPVTPKPPPLRVSIYLLYKKTLSCINYWLNYSNYDASAWPELSFGNLIILSVLTTLCPKSVRKWGWGGINLPTA